MSIHTDVTSPESVHHAIHSIIEQHDHIDILINCVGWTHDRLFMQKPRSEWKREVNVNLWSVINLIHAVLPYMIQARKGTIVSVGSDAGRIGEYREAVYSACKVIIGIILLRF